MRARVGYSVAACVIASLLGALLALACGARSELELSPWREQAGGAAPDAGPDAPPDAPPDVPDDVPLDVPPDVPLDAPPDDCSDPDITYIYLVSDAEQLYAYDPSDHSFEFRGNLDCPAGGATPFSMAVDRAGVAHVLYNDGNLYKVSTADASCEITNFVVGQFGFQLFGMGYAADAVGTGETLHVAEISFSDPSLGLGTIDTESYVLSYIGPFSDNPGNAIELTPTADGPLYGYFLNEPPPGGTLVEIDQTTADIVKSTQVDVGQGSSALAFAWWAGDFYIFTTLSGGGTTVSRFDPDTQTAQQVATASSIFVGAGVSTCAPRQ